MRVPLVVSTADSDDNEAISVTIHSEYGCHGDHEKDIDHYLKTQFLYNRDATAHIKQTLQPLVAAHQRRLALTSSANEDSYAVSLVNNTEMQIALINPDGIQLDRASEQRIFARTLGE